MSRAIHNVKTASVLISLTVFAGCGGQVSTPINKFPPAVNYSFITPAAGSQSTYTDTIVDNTSPAPNTLTRTLIETITAVNSGGVFTASWSDPSMSTTFFGSVDQSFYPTVVNYNNVGQSLNYVVTPYSGSPDSCTATPHLGEPPSPLTQAQNWTSSYTLTCSSDAPVSYSQVGQFQDMEQLVVPAGTFNSYRFTSVITYTDAGLPTTRFVTTWVNATSTDSRVLQETVNYLYNGTAPQGSTMSETTSLVSYQ